MKRRRYTLVLHISIGGSYGNWQIIEFRRVSATPRELSGYKKRLPVHFVIKGWPDVRFPNGLNFFAKRIPR